MKLRTSPHRMWNRTPRPQPEPPAVSPAALRPNPAARRQAHRDGVALVVTLILLAVITTLAIAFIALTQRETAAVAATSSTTDAELAAEAAFERAKAEIVSRIQRENTRNFGSSVVGPDFMVSVAADQNRVDSAGAFTDPSPPVFVNTNVAGGTGLLDERYFLDLNRNLYFDETGFVPQTTDALDGTTGRYQAAIDPATGQIATNWVVGDPMWIGILSSPLNTHATNNRFISRYAWAAFPVGRSLDINAIHNQAVGPALNLNSGPSGFFRNQGLGSWEINLAGFLADLNTNEWPASAGQYEFSPLKYDGNAANLVASGPAFDDARSVLIYRYDRDITSLNNPSQIFSQQATAVNAPAIFTEPNGDGLDYFNLQPIGPSADYDNSGKPWVGSRNKRNFQLLIHDLWNTNKFPGAKSLSSRLASSSAQGNSYDRYTYYRLLSQLGTDSTPEDDSGKIHVNYVNLRSWVNPDFRLQSSDMVSWNTRTPEFINRMGRKGPDLFFLTTVRKLFLQDTNYASFVSNQTTLPDRPLRIPIYTNGSRFVVRNYGGTFTTNALYSGRIHQILQQAANIYDAVRDWEPNERPEQHAGLFPSVFRPVYEVDGNDVYIVNYTFIEPEDTSITGRSLMTAVWRDLDLGEKPQSDDYVYNIPLILGARKGFPNFNEFASRTSVLGVRRLEARKAAGERDINKFTFIETFNLYATNDFGFEAWNSYFTNAYPRSIGIFFTNQAIVQIKRDNVVVRTIPANEGVAPPRSFFTANQWASARVGARSFFATNFPTRQLFGWTNVAPVSAAGPTHNWSISVTNRIRFFLYDAQNRLVDAVGLSLGNEFYDLGRELSTPWEGARGASQIWTTNRINGRNWQEGIESQLNISRGFTGLSEQDWKNFGPTSQNRTDGIRSFNNFVESETDTSTQVPFIPSRVVTQTNNWRAADPLVHYTAEDLWRGAGSDRRANQPVPPLEFGAVNPEYMPWSDEAPTTKQPTLRDPGVRSPDLWNFPTNKVPTVGFLGRVHRGTPFQSIYLKSDAVGLDTWRRHNNITRPFDTAQAMMPTNDWKLLDIFTSTIHPNASRGRLSINQTNLAAWSAVLSGVVPSTVTNETVEEITAYRGANTVVNPAALGVAGDAPSQYIQTLVTAINRLRGNRQFRRMSDLLAVPELTSVSPLLTANGQFNPRRPQDDIGVYDYDYESVPERILGLLKVGEARYVIYSWGQSLKPAEFGIQRQGAGFVPRGPSIETAGPRRGLVNNYQITGELSTRAVVRIEFPRFSEDPRSPLYDEYDYRRPQAVVESFNLISPD